MIGLDGMGFSLTFFSFKTYHNCHNLKYLGSFPAMAQKHSSKSGLCGDHHGADSFFTPCGLSVDPKVFHFSEPRNSTETPINIS